MVDGGRISWDSPTMCGEPGSRENAFCRMDGSVGKVVRGGRDEIVDSR